MIPNYQTCFPILFILENIKLFSKTIIEQNIRPHLVTIFK